jgi:hypothetical protein
MNSFDTIVQKPLDQSEASISVKIMEVWSEPKQDLWTPYMSPHFQFEEIRMNSFDTIVRKPLDQSEASISLKSWRRVQYPNKTCGAPIWAHIFNLNGFAWIVLTQLSRNLSTNQRPAFLQNHGGVTSTETRPVESLYEPTFLIWRDSDE